MSYKIPVTKNFSQRVVDQIGSLTIYDDNFQIPESAVFAIGYRIVKTTVDKKTGKQVMRDYEVLEVSLIPNNQCKCSD